MVVARPLLKQTGLIMRYILVSGLMAVSLAACAPTMPDSAAGVGLDDYDAYRDARETTLMGGVPAPDTVESATLDSDGSAMNSDTARDQDFTGSPAPSAVTNAAGISDENDFETVSEERDIDADASLIARNRQQYQVIEPTALPMRPGTDRPNIVEYALQTDNPLGTQLFRRTGFRAEARAQRACAQYASADLAQEAFLAGGGPERDREGLDPDGDGFACGWSPEPFRAVRGR